MLPRPFRRSRAQPARPSPRVLLRGLAPVSTIDRSGPASESARARVGTAPARAVYRQAVPEQPDSRSSKRAAERLSSPKGVAPELVRAERVARRVQPQAAARMPEPHRGPTAGPGWVRMRLRPRWSLRRAALSGPAGEAGAVARGGPCA